MSTGFQSHLSHLRENVRQHCWSQHYIVTGPGGARTDFVCNWLSSIRNYFHYIERHWNMCPKTGATFGTRPYLFSYNFYQTKFFDNRDRQSLNEFLRTTYDPGTKYLVSKSHNIARQNNQVVDEDLRALIRQLSIMPPHNDTIAFATMVWEFVTKTFMRDDVHQCVFAIEQRGGMSPGSIISDEIACSVINRIITEEIDRFPPRYNCEIEPNEIRLDYREICSPAGGRYLAKTLDLQDVDPFCFELYERASAIARTPQSMQSFGRVWHWQDVFDRVCSYFPKNQ